jgi:hypothetical protein
LFFAAALEHTIFETPIKLQVAFHGYLNFLCIFVFKLDYPTPWPTKSELRCAYYGRNKARIFNGAIDSANLKKCTLNQLHLLAKWKRKM